MLVYSSGRFNPKRNGHGYEYYSRDGICGCCGKVIGSQISDTKEGKFYFENREKKDYKFCPYCGKLLNENKER